MLWCLGLDFHGELRSTSVARAVVCSRAQLTYREVQKLLDAGVDLPRVLPPATDAALQKLRVTAEALRIPWPEEVSYPEFVRGPDPETGTHAAMPYACTMLFRGAGYRAFDGRTPEQSEHSAPATPCAQVTAPLRRLVDRCGSEVARRRVPGNPFPSGCARPFRTPEERESSARKASVYERGIVNMVETLALSARVGEEFTATVVEALGAHVEVAHDARAPSRGTPPAPAHPTGLQWDAPPQPPGG